jgi:aldose 1-epimerase
MVSGQGVRFGDDDVELTVLPQVGARWHRLQVFGHDLLRTPRDLGEHQRDTFFWGAYPMAPWCGRVDAGSQEIAGRQVALEPNFPDGTAIHGQVFAVPWRATGEGHFAVSAGGDGWPWMYEVEFGVEVVANELRLTYLLRNTSDGPMPAGIGVHPWFRKPISVRVPASGVLTPNQATPRDATPVTGPFDLRRLRGMPDDLDATWTDLAEPRVELHWPDAGVRATMRARAERLYIVAASPSHLDAIALEPQTHAPQALRRLLNGEPGALAMLPPGGELRLGVELAFERAETRARAA